MAGSARIRRVISETFVGLGTPDRAGRPVQELIMVETERERGSGKAQTEHSGYWRLVLAAGLLDFSLQYVPSIDPLFGEQPRDILRASVRLRSRHVGFHT